MEPINVKQAIALEAVRSAVLTNDKYVLLRSETILISFLDRIELAFSEGLKIVFRFISEANFIWRASKNPDEDAVTFEVKIDADKFPFEFNTGRPLDIFRDPTIAITFAGSINKQGFAAIHLNLWGFVEEVSPIGVEHVSKT